MGRNMQLSFTGMVLGIEQTAVNPPFAATFNPDSMVSLYLWMGLTRKDQHIPREDISTGIIIKTGRPC